MTTHIIYRRADGGCTLVTPIAGLLEFVLINDIPAGATNIQVIDRAEIPARTFRNAWRAERNGIEIHLPTARTIHTARIREARDNHPDWPKIDADRAQALEDSDSVLLADVKARADVLRNLPDTVAAEIAAADDPDLLDAIWPDPLPQR